MDQLYEASALLLWQIRLKIHRDQGGGSLLQRSQIVSHSFRSKLWAFGWCEASFGGSEWAESRLPTSKGKPTIVADHTLDKGRIGQESGIDQVPNSSFDLWMQARTRANLFESIQASACKYYLISPHLGWNGFD